MKTAEQKQREKLLKEVAGIQTMKGAKQWRAARDFALKVNPELAKEHTVHLQELVTIREQQDNEFATSKGGHFKFSLSIPVTMMKAIRAFDPSFMTYNKRKYKGVADTNAEARRLMRAFPEYKIPLKG